MRNSGVVETERRAVVRDRGSFTGEKAGVADAEQVLGVLEVDIGGSFLAQVIPKDGVFYVPVQEIRSVNGASSRSSGAVRERRVPDAESREASKVDGPSREGANTLKL